MHLSSYPTLSIYISVYPECGNWIFFFRSCQFSTEIFEREFCEIDKRVLSKHHFCLLNIYELQAILQLSNIVFVSCLLPSQTNNNKSDVFTRKKNCYVREKASWWKLICSNLFFLQKITFCNAYKRRFFRWLSAWVELSQVSIQRKKSSIAMKSVRFRWSSLDQLSKRIRIIKIRHNSSVSHKSRCKRRDSSSHILGRYLGPYLVNRRRYLWTFEGVSKSVRIGVSDKE